jgi:hypothetical protein
VTVSRSRESIKRVDRTAFDPLLLSQSRNLRNRLRKFLDDNGYESLNHLKWHYEDRTSRNISGDLKMEWALMIAEGSLEKIQIRETTR